MELLSSAANLSQQIKLERIITMVPSTKCCQVTARHCQGPCRTCALVFSHPLPSLIFKTTIDDGAMVPKGRI